MDVNKIHSFQIKVASPEAIRSWSFGEVTKPETINYRTLKPERDGLFCEKIFGPTRDYECSCGKYKKVMYKGKTCERCGVDIVTSKVRRERMGHIELVSPVVHSWFLDGNNDRVISTILDISKKDVENVVYFVKYVVTDPKDTELQYKQVLSELEYRKYVEKYGFGFDVMIGAEAIEYLLQRTNVSTEITAARAEFSNATGQKKVKLVKRLGVLEGMHTSGNEPSWLVLKALPVIPPELRPMVQLDGGRFAVSDLNDLYRRVINRNNRLKKLIELRAPEIIVRNEKRMLQEAVDALIDNGKRGRAVTGPNRRPLKSLTSLLKGKQGRFRQNLLGKRVDYSGRSVIVVGPNLKLHECGLPKGMALELFKPFVMKELVERELAANVKAAKRKIELGHEDVWGVLEDVVREHPVLLNRAPTLHRLGIQAFEPKLVEGKAIRLSPLVCAAYNADFDGDQMAVHVPLSQEAQSEARLLMLASQNILNPKDGQPIVSPSQDMVLGNYYLTLESKNDPGLGKVFSSPKEALLALDNDYINWHSKIAVKASSIGNPTFTEEQNASYLMTTVGKILFNDEVLPKGYPYLNEPTLENLQATPDKYFIRVGENIREVIETAEEVEPFKSKFLSQVISDVFEKYNLTITAGMLDNLKDTGYRYSTKAGISISVADIVVLEEKTTILTEAQKEVDIIMNFFRNGLMTEDERYQAVIAIWAQTKDIIQGKLMASLPKTNNIFMMSDSGARGNASNFTQLAGMRGLMAAPSGRTIELPVKSSFREGLTVLEYFISTHGARKGLADTALKTADSGYLTRRLVDVAQDVIVNEDDCHTDKGMYVTAMMDGTEIIVQLRDRIQGRFTNEDVRAEDGRLIIAKDKFITDSIAKEIQDLGIKGVEIRTALTCKSEKGVCRKCYGRNMASGDIVEVGEAVGVIAAQSIGEPGTQLTMRTFHTGGVAGSDITQGLPRIQELFEARNPKGKAVLSKETGEVSIFEKDGYYEINVENDQTVETYRVPLNARISVKSGQHVVRGQHLTEGAFAPKELLETRHATSVQEYILKEVQKVYRLQGVGINDKHIEVIVRQMMKKHRVIDSGDTTLINGSLIDSYQLTKINADAIRRSRRPATVLPEIFGISKASVNTESFLSAASFQQTRGVLTGAAIRGKTDELVGLKENVIIGKLIPAGTGMKRYSDLSVHIPEPETEDEVVSIEEFFLA